MTESIYGTYVTSDRGLDVFGVVEGETVYEWRFGEVIHAAASRATSLVPVESLEVLDEDVWFEGACRRASLRLVAAEVRRTLKADLSRPLLFIEGFGLIDGTHRVVKALVAGVSMLPCVELSRDELFHIAHVTRPVGVDEPWRRNLSHNRDAT